MLPHLPGTLATAQLDSSNLPRSGWKKPQNARPPGSLPGQASLVPTPPSSSWKSTGRLVPFRPAGRCMLYSTHAGPVFANCECCLVCPWAGTGGKPFPPPKKAVFKKYLGNVHSLSGVGVRCLLDRLALQLRTLWSSSKEAGKECETLPLKEQKGFFVCLFSVAFFFLSYFLPVPIGSGLWSLLGVSASWRRLLPKPVVQQQASQNTWLDIPGAHPGPPSSPLPPLPPSPTLHPSLSSPLPWAV